ncbi:MAG: DNA methylase, partial [Gammaproteobacteria bacterium]|nr:DNA methylase [Gammaproteobacteria bacterium]
MGNPWFGSKATSGLWQALVSLMPPHAVYIETHLGGGAVMRRKPAALRNIGIDLDRRALASFECGHAVELVQADCHAWLAGFAFDGSELVYSDPPYLRGARKSARRYRHDYADADHVALLELLGGLPCAA